MYSIMIKNKNNNESIKVTVRYACEKASSWGDGCDSYKHNRVKVENLTTRKRCSFDYWGSTVEPNQESKEGVVNAISCYALDANAFNCSRSFEDFCSEFGYDIEFDSRKAKKAYKGCEKADKDLSRVVGDYDFLYELENFSFDELQEKGIVKVM